MSQIVEKIYRRIDSVDFLRGLVMVIMLIDHTREYVHADAFRFTPTDLTKTNVALFFTRWITHFCAPTFVFLAGTSIYLQKMRGKSTAELSKFLLTRGLWLIVLEFTVVRFSLFFNFDYSFFGLAEVIWIFGVSMIVLAALIRLPARVVAALGIAAIALHNLLDRFTVPPAISMAGMPAPDALQKLWMFLHQPGFVPLAPDVKMFVAYPLIPWVGVMAAGYALGVVYTWEAERRRKFLLKLGLILTALFVMIRATNLYGDPEIWTAQPSPLFTVLSFLNTTKYPASLLFLLMTIGPALMILSLTDKINAPNAPNEQGENNFLSRILITFGRVPLFYFILQMFVAHLFGILLSLLVGKSIGFYFLNFPNSSTDAPPNAGFPLWVVYATWLAGLIVLYPLCRWYGKIKQGRRGFPFSYL
ncbi:MAG TPA: heparan-alpha-glucosaminide N-acetyltransferase domain-containing protein [Pyrinomonadaceae bacterium]